MGIPIFGPIAVAATIVLPLMIVGTPLLLLALKLLERRYPEEKPEGLFLLIPTSKQMPPPPKDD